MAESKNATVRNHYDLVVIGAGWYGLTAAKVYHQLHPDERFVIFEAANSCGGTWASDRLYPGLQSNNIFDTYEHPDFPMQTDKYGVKPDEHIPGTVVHQYLTDFAKHFDIYPYIRFKTSIASLAKQPSGAWVVGTTAESDGGRQEFAATKVIIASGLTSDPNLPQYQGSDTFHGPFFHAKDFCHNAKTVDTSQDVVVVGGGKSAFDVAYAYADAGVPNVHMVIRPNGNGPLWLSYAWVMGGKKRLEKLTTVRWMTWFSPNIFGGIDGWGWVRRLLHGTMIGRFLVKQFWDGIQSEVIKKNGHRTHPELQKLEPWNRVFWFGSGLGIHNYPNNFWEMVKTGRVKVHIANIDRLSDHKVHLSTGDSIEADVIVAATGWNKNPSLKFNVDDAGMGLSLDAAERQELTAQADRAVFSQLPILRHQPAHKKAPVAAEPFRLYRYMVPSSRFQARDLAFAGMVSTVSTACVATVQALWICAYLDGKLDLEAKDAGEVTREILLHTQWMKWRHPTGYGAQLPDMVFDSLPYMDLLLKDLGLKVNRKPGWFRDITEPYGPPDFVDLVAEWQSTHQKI